MKVVLVHGRGQEDENPVSLKKRWVTALNKSFQEADIRQPRWSAIEFPFYALILDYHRERKVSIKFEDLEELSKVTWSDANGESLTAERAAKERENLFNSNIGHEPTRGSFDEIALLKALAVRAGATDEEVEQATSETADFGFEIDFVMDGRYSQENDSEYGVEFASRNAPFKPWSRVRRTVAETRRKLLELIADRTPDALDEAVVGSITRDVDLYLDNRELRWTINNLVIKAVGDEPAIVIAHSLGTIVAYDALRQAELTSGLDTDQVRLFMTLGSPIGIDLFRHSIEPPKLAIPARRWVNFSDPADTIALSPKLTKETFIGGIENYKVENETGWHDVTEGGYLTHPEVAEILHRTWAQS